MSLLPDYFSDFSARLLNESESIRKFFQGHKLTAGESKEDLVSKFLTSHLPKRFYISPGLIVSKEGEFSSQADVTATDQINNAPSERPDFIIAPDSILLRLGHYLELSKTGQIGSGYRKQLHQAHGDNVHLLLGNGIEIYDLGQNSLLEFIILYSSWLKAAGNRSATLAKYLPSNEVFDHII